MKITIIGSGNVATILGRTVVKSGHQVLQVISRNSIHAQKLAIMLGATATGSVMELHPECAFCIIAVSDSSIRQVAQLIPPTNAVVVHTAGSVQKDVLLHQQRAYGVIYPLQTLRMHIEQLPEIPVLIDGGNNETLNKIRMFADTWANGVWQAGDEKRLHTHLAAVILNNFTNHLVSLTQEYCAKEHIDFNILMPLLQQTIQNLNYNHASELQTGPASRNDIGTIEKHLLILTKQPILRSLYLKLSDSIISQQIGMFKDS